MSDDASRAKTARILAALERFEGPLLLYATRLLGERERAQDAVQETFLRLCARDPADLEGRLAEWLYTVCRNLALDARKKERPMATTSDGQLLDRPDAVGAGPAAAAEKSETLSRVLRSLSALPANQQEVLRLKFQHGLSYREISRVTELSVGNVGYLIHMGLKSLRERLAGSPASEAMGGAK